MNHTCIASTCPDINRIQNVSLYTQSELGGFALRSHKSLRRNAIEVNTCGISGGYVSMAIHFTLLKIFDKYFYFAIDPEAR